MTPAELTAKELRILVQSLTNCLKTCEVHAKQPAAACEDCDAARALKQKLEQQLKS